MSFIAKLLGSKVIQYFLSKKKIISFIAGIAMAALAGLLGMKSGEFKDAVCSASVPIEVPAAPLPMEANPPK